MLSFCRSANKWFPERESEIRINFNYLLGEKKNSEQAERITSWPSTSSVYRTTPFPPRGFQHFQNRSNSTERGRAPSHFWKPLPVAEKQFSNAKSNRGNGFVVVFFFFIPTFSYIALFFWIQEKNCMIISAIKSLIVYLLTY